MKEGIQLKFLAKPFAFQKMEKVILFALHLEKPTAFGVL